MYEKNLNLVAKDRKFNQFFEEMLHVAKKRGITTIIYDEITKWENTLLGCFIHDKRKDMARSTSLMFEKVQYSNKKLTSAGKKYREGKGFILRIDGCNTWKNCQKKGHKNLYKLK